MTETPSQVLQKSRDLMGKPVISLLGEELGSVARLITDPANGRVAGLTLSVKGWFKGEKAAEFASVYAFGDYAITVKENDQVVPLNTLPALEKLSQECNLYGMRIITPEGKLIGAIEDYYFDVKTGAIVKYILTGGIIKNLFKGRAGVPADSISRIGKDVVIASADVEDAIENEENSLQDNLDNLKGELGHFKNDLEHWKEDLEKVWDKTRTRTIELSKTVGENLKGQLRNSYDTWTERLQKIKNGPDKTLTEEDLKSLIGLKAGQTVVDEKGAVIVFQNSPITRSTIDEAQKAGKMKELLIALATRDLEDKINSIEGKTPDDTPNQ